MPGEGTLQAGLAADLDGCFERLVREFQDRLFSFALRLTGSREDGEEVAQDALVRAYRALKTYPAERVRALALRPWLYRITLNVVRNRLRGKKPKLVSMNDHASESDRASWEADDPATRPDSRLEQRQGRTNLAMLVAELPPRYRSALILRYVEGLRVEEVAAILQQPLGTTKSNLHRAVNALRIAISQSRSGKREVKP